MIRAIVAIDDKRGLADDHDIPWDLPSDRQQFRDKITSAPALMGYGQYAMMKKPFANTQNLVATHKDEVLRPGFEKVPDPVAYVSNAKSTNIDVWVVGGAGLFASVMELVDEVYITRVDGDFHCTKFFPEYKDDFEMVSQTPDQQENGLTFRYQVWRRKGLSKN